jgi:hypothetical protein
MTSSAPSKRLPKLGSSQSGGPRTSPISGSDHAPRKQMLQKYNHQRNTSRTFSGSRHDYPSGHIKQESFDRKSEGSIGRYSPPYFGETMNVMKRPNTGHDPRPSKRAESRSPRHSPRPQEHIHGTSPGPDSTRVMSPSTGIHSSAQTPLSSPRPPLPSTSFLSARDPSQQLDSTILGPLVRQKSQDDPPRAPPEMYLQPETRPISQEQLVNEVKGIYAGLVCLLHGLAVATGFRTQTVCPSLNSSFPPSRHESSTVY